MKPDQLLDEFGKGSTRALSRLISLAENGDPAVRDILAGLYDRVGRARVIGVTGPPGAGKSTLVGAFLRWARGRGKRVAVLAVDPVSPLTGGALLGDRIRLADHFNDPGVYIRSLSTRGRLGGLSQATREAVHLADAFGMDYVVVETVGVGQNEVDIRLVADLSLVVLVPESGDDIQALKAGVLEIGDLYVVNKADREGADKVVTELKRMLEMSHRPDVEVLAASQGDPKSQAALFDACETYFTTRGAAVAARRNQGARATAVALLEGAILTGARRYVDRHVGEAKNPYAFIREFLAKHPVEDWFGK